MIYVTVERIVRRRPEVVWEFLTDATSLATWIEGAIEARVTNDVTSGVGMEIEIVRRAWRASTEVTAWREPSLVAVETRLPGKMFLGRATLESCAEGTRLGVYSEILFQDKLDELLTRPGGLLRASPIDPELQRIHEASVDALVKRIEALSAVPYR